MTRSLGDSVAASVGVISEPEIIEYQYSKNDKILVLGSDGLWEFLENAEIVKLLAPYYLNDDLEGACEMLLNEAVSRWNKVCSVVDDITFVIVFLKNSYINVSSSNIEK